MILDLSNVVFFEMGRPNMRRNHHLAGLAMVLLSAKFASAADVEARLPADTEVVVSVNVTQIINSPLGAKYVRSTIEEALKHNPQGQEALNYLGLDPLRDITRLTVAMTSAANKDGLVIVRGKFNRDKIDDLAGKVAADQKDKLTIHKSGSTTVYEIAGEKKMFATFPDDSTLLISTNRARLSAPPSKPKKEMLALIAQADGKQAIWFVALPEVTNELKNTDDTQKQLLDRLAGILGVVKFETNVRLELALLSKTAQSAAATGKMINDMVGLAKAFAPQAVKDKPELSPLLEIINSIHAAARDKLVLVTAEFTAEQIERAIKTIASGK
jgi:hypothetical protein